MSFDCERVPLSSLGQIDYLSEIARGDRAGVIIPSVLDSAWLAEVATRLKTPERYFLGEDLKLQISSGRLSTIGTAISRYNGQAAHFDTADAVSAGMERLFAGGPSYTEMVAEVLFKLDNRPVRAATDSTHGRTFATCSVRRVPVGAEIPLHAENNHSSWPGYRALAGHEQSESILSYYLLVQAPGSGGELEIVDVLQSDPRVQVQPNGMLRTALLEGIDRVTVPLSVGDLIVFDGGRYVHRVQRVDAPPMRITIGGFVRRVGEHQELFC